MYVLFISSFLDFEVLWGEETAEVWLGYRETVEMRLG
jgi:hypothetical protein